MSGTVDDQDDKNREAHPAALDGFGPTVVTPRQTLVSSSTRDFPALKLPDLLPLPNEPYLKTVLRQAQEDIKRQDNTARREMDERARQPVSLPRNGPTVSYWQDPPDRIADHRTTDELPASADIVIIGSGITGAAVAWNLLKHAPVPTIGDAGDAGPKIVMLEARQACSGATGRNGGHTKAASYRTFTHHVATLGIDEAVKIARLELANIQAVQTFAACHNLAVDADVQPCNTVDVVYDEKEWEAAKSAVRAMRAALGAEDAAARYELYSPEQVKEQFYCPSSDDDAKVYGGVGYFAGSLSAYALTIGLLKMCLGRGLNLQTGTAAEKVSQHGDGAWEVRTPRGTILAREVVVATNGYTAGLLDAFQGVIVPLRGQVTAQRPGSDMPLGGSLPTTYSFIYPGGYEYMVPRPAGSRYAGDIVIGGGLVRAEKQGLDEYGTTDDTTVNETISRYLAETTRKYFGENWGADHPAGRVRREWTGIMGYSPDGFPFVGEVPHSSGLWISASFQGHGMVLCWKCAEALVAMMSARRDGVNDGLDSWFPDAFRISEERMQKRFLGRLHTSAAPSLPEAL